MWNRRCEGGEPLVLLGETRRTRCSNKSRERLQIVYNQPNSLFSRTSSLSDHWQAQSPLTRESRSLIRPQYAVKFSPAQGGRKGREGLKTGVAVAPVVARWRRIMRPHSGC